MVHGEEGERARASEREREGGPKCCQFAALIFQLWPVRLEKRGGALDAELTERKHTVPNAAYTCKAVYCAHSKISSFLRDAVMIQPIRLLTPSLLLMTDLFSSVSLSSAAHK